MCGVPEGLAVTVLCGNYRPICPNEPPRKGRTPHETTPGSSQGSPHKRNTEREREREKAGEGLGRQIYFQELAHLPGGAGKSKICRVSGQARAPGKCWGCSLSPKAIQRQNSLFLMDLSLFSWGLQLTEWGPPTRWRVICFTRISTHLNLTVAYKIPSQWHLDWYLAKLSVMHLTHKTHHHTLCFQEYIWPWGWYRAIHKVAKISMQILLSD